jgi:hypothetical protein
MTYVTQRLSTIPPSWRFQTREDSIEMLCIWCITSENLQKPKTIQVSNKKHIILSLTWEAEFIPLGHG